MFFTDSETNSTYRDYVKQSSMINDWIEGFQKVPRLQGSSIHKQNHFWKFSLVMYVLDIGPFLVLQHKKITLLSTAFHVHKYKLIKRPK